MKSIYLIGSLRNPEIPNIAIELRKQGYDAFDAWYSAGPEADDCWQAHERLKSAHHSEAMNGYHAWEVFQFDKFHLDRCDCGVLIMPSGKSGHVELGYMTGTGKPTFILFDKEPERFDVMHRFAKDFAYSTQQLIQLLDKEFKEKLHAVK